MTISPQLCIRCHLPTWNPAYPQAICDVPKDGSSLFALFDSSGWPENTGIGHIECLSSAERKLMEIEDQMFELDNMGILADMTLEERFFVPGALV
jgi:hypothetical protein